MYIGSPILNLAGVQLQNSINHITSSDTTIVLDSDGSEEPAVTTDVMLSGNLNEVVSISVIKLSFFLVVLGSSLCAQGSPLDFSDKNDEIENTQSRDTSWYRCIMQIFYELNARLWINKLSRLTRTTSDLLRCFYTSCLEIARSLPYKPVELPWDSVWNLPSLVHTVDDFSAAFK